MNSAFLISFFRMVLLYNGVFSIPCVWYYLNYLAADTYEVLRNSLPRNYHEPLSSDTSFEVICMVDCLDDDSPKRSRSPPYLLVLVISFGFYLMLHAKLSQRALGLNNGLSLPH
jgi:hypothetical protein